METQFYQLSTWTVLGLLGLFYVGTFVITLFIGKKEESAEGYVVSNHNIGFGISAASMTATWIWAASFYGSATSAYNYGLSGSMHYGFWGALMILFIYPFGKRIRALAPNGRTLAEVIHARHGASSQMILAVSNLVGSVISLMVNFTAAGALVSVLSPLSFQDGVLISGGGVLLYTLWSGFRASVLTDFIQVSAMIAIAVVVIPLVYFNIGGEDVLMQGLAAVTAEQANFFSTKAILEQGAPFFIAVLAYAIGNQTISQRLFAVREDLIKPTFITATLGYGSVVIGLGMLGLMALLTGMIPAGGDNNNIIPQIASQYLSPFMIGLLFILVIGSLSSTADSDLSALASITMTDIYSKHFAKKGLKLKTMLLIGRMTMIIATVLGLILASYSFDILVALVFVGALWGAIVYPVISSCYWDKVTNKAFTTSVVVALLVFCLVRFELVALEGLFAYAMEIISAVGAGVVIGMMVFAFSNITIGKIAGVTTSVVCMYFFTGFLREYTVLTCSLLSYGTSFIVCYGMSVTNKEKFDFALIPERIKNFEEGK